jgi:hypothetical protein
MHGKSRLLCAIALNRCRDTRCAGRVVTEVNEVITLGRLPLY